MNKIVNPEISIIICSFNTKKVTLECLDNLKRSIDYLNKPIEVIVVENGTDGTAETIRKDYPWVKVIEPGENTGFAKGNNLGIKASNEKSKYILLLNSDVMVNPETLTKSIKFMENNSKCDVLGCRLIYGDNKLQPSGGFFPTPMSVFTWILGIDLIPFINIFLKSFHQKDQSFFNSDRQIDWIMGAYLFMKHEVIAKTHGLDEKLFMYMEEVEWCKRIKDAGFSIWYTPSFFVNHLDKTSSRDNIESFRKITQKEILGVIYFLKKYYPGQYFLTLVLIKFGLYLRVFAFFLLGDKDRCLSYMETLKII